MTKVYLQLPDAVRSFLIQLTQINRIHLAGQQLNALKTDKQLLLLFYIVVELNIVCMHMFTKPLCLCFATRSKPYCEGFAL